MCFRDVLSECFLTRRPISRQDQLGRPRLHLRRPLLRARQVRLRQVRRTGDALRERHVVRLRVQREHAEHRDEQPLNTAQRRGADDDGGDVDGSDARAGRGGRGGGRDDALGGGDLVVCCECVWKGLKREGVLVECRYGFVHFGWVVHLGPRATHSLCIPSGLGRVDRR